MMYFMSLLILTQLVLVIVMWGIWQEFRKIRESVDQYVQGLHVASTQRRSHATTEGFPLYDVFAIWAWRDGNWELEEDTVPPGHESHLPPKHPGAFEGERVRVQCVKRGAR